MRHIKVTFTGPPEADMASFVSISDDQGNDLAGIGQWQHDGAFWQYVIPTELVPRIVLPADVSGRPDSAELAPGSPQAVRRALRERLAKTPLPAAPAQQAGDDSPTALDTCPSCATQFDPRKDSMLVCQDCGKQRCTAVCMPDINNACVHCQNSGAAGNGPAGADEAAEVMGGTLFNGRSPRAGRERAGSSGVPPPPDDDDDDNDDRDRSGVTGFEDVTPIGRG